LILVLGFYGKQNAGDNLFIDAFKFLFPEQYFKFVDCIKYYDLLNATAIFIGGGSFLDTDPNIDDDCFELLKTKKIFYIGVGTETNISQGHLDLMKTASLIAIRSDDKFDFIKNINTNTILVPDLAYSLNRNILINNKINKSILIIPNILVIPQNTDPHWKHSSWEFFKSEFSQFLDFMIEQDYTINFLTMCNNNKLNDEYAGAEIVSSMKHRDFSYLLKNEIDFISILEIFSKYEYIITQRYHGIILAELQRTPYLSIWHHEKLKNSYLNEGNFINYYGASKQNFIDQFKSMKDKKLKNVISIKQNMFEELKSKVKSLI
jgi:polysaccharide pyruvyl transferase WcaK-like protein